jgi:UPF0176 protein
MEYEVIIFYKYTRVADPAGFVAWQRALCERLNIKGRILIAHEGINGTVEGTKESIVEYCAAVRSQNGSAGTFGDFADLWFKSSPGNGSAFQKLKVKARREILNMGVAPEKDIDPNRITGAHIEATELKQWIENGEDFVIVDMRNDYEYDVGHFAGSVKSGMQNFRDLPQVVPALADLQKKKVVTVCTYGVRCEKASGYLKQQGFNEVYQLHGGIGTYMKQYPGQDFMGSLYVFDERMTEQFTDKYDVVGACVACGAKSERFGNCAWDECHKQLIICNNCAATSGSIFCSARCRESLQSCPV